MIRWRIVLLSLLVLAYLATGLVVVQQDEVGVVRRFGAVLPEPWRPGLHWGLPWGLGRVDRVKTGQTRTLTIGAPGQAEAPLTRNPNPSNDDFLTGDLNLVTAQAILQYGVTDPATFLFSATSVDEALRLATESALTLALSERGIDDVLTVGRAEVAERMRRVIESEAQHQGLGVTIRAVRLGRVAPPAAVAPAFADAARARSDKRQAITSAEEYQQRALADANGQVREISDRAIAEHERLIKTARGEAERFAKVLAESRKDMKASRNRLYLETLSELLPRFHRTVVVTPGQDLDLSLFSEDSASETARPNEDPTRDAGQR